MTAITIADLRRIDLFDELDDDALAEWAAATQPLAAAPGDILVEQGEPPRGTLLLLDGTMQTLMLEGERQEPVGRQTPPTWMAAIAVLPVRTSTFASAAICSMR